MTPSASKLFGRVFLLAVCVLSAGTTTQTAFADCGGGKCECGEDAICSDKKCDCKCKHKLPTVSLCEEVCPGCTSPQCKCPEGACWPGSGLTDTPRPECKCFAQLGFCKEGEKPEWADGAECPSCWPADNKACDCFAVLGFCDAAPSANLLQQPAGMAGFKKATDVGFSGFTGFMFLSGIAMAAFTLSVRATRVGSTDLQEGLLAEP